MKTSLASDGRCPELRLCVCCVNVCVNVRFVFVDVEGEIDSSPGVELGALLTTGILYSWT